MLKIDLNNPCVLSIWLELILGKVLSEREELDHCMFVTSCKLGAKSYNHARRVDCKVEWKSCKDEETKMLVVSLVMRMILLLQSCCSSQRVLK
jgi:membrane glycosyltransferase